ncbi:hypothetical protein BGZ50_002541 [Haplosporangium sp. Z 11]|nr:hypothetical protein BGZ50_002541 [Haplosporangium sp. Z 11]
MQGSLPETKSPRVEDKDEELPPHPFKDKCAMRRCKRSQKTEMKLYVHYGISLPLPPSLMRTAVYASSSTLLLSASDHIDLDSTHLEKIQQYAATTIFTKLISQDLSLICKNHSSGASLSLRSPFGQPSRLPIGVLYPAPIFN